MRATKWMYGCLLVTACGSPAGTPTPDANNDIIKVADASDGTNTTVDAAPPGWPTGPIRPKRYRISDPVPTLAPCSGGDVGGAGDIAQSTVLLGQTHLLPIASPFQTIAAERPLTLAIAAIGQGPTPAMTVTARLGNESIAICFAGPNVLSPAVDMANAYRAVLPARWVAPGLTIELNIAGELTTVQPHILPRYGATLYYINAQLFGQGTVVPADESVWAEYQARLPGSYLDVGINPFGVWRPSRLMISARTDGTTPTGEAASHGAIIVTENPHCSTSDKANGTCTLHSGYAVMSGVLDTLDTFRNANGLDSSATWYAQLAVPLGGGLGGGQRGTGDDAQLAMNHEIGHAWGFPHWAATDTDYPYEGVQRQRGGVGDSWAIDQRNDLLIGPTCGAMERQSPMQRATSCMPPQVKLDPYSDYEVARISRMVTGAATPIKGEVAYSGGMKTAATRAFTLPTEDGRPLNIWHPNDHGFSVQQYDQPSNSWQDQPSTAWDQVVDGEVPVTMFYGAAAMGVGAFIEPPIEYIGNVLRGLDPTVTADLTEIYFHRFNDFYWANDMVFRFTLENGTVFNRIHNAEALLRKAGDKPARFAINLPVDIGRRVKKFEVLARPLGQYSASSRLSSTEIAANYLSNATVLATWNAP